MENYIFCWQNWLLVMKPMDFWLGNAKNPCMKSDCLPAVHPEAWQRLDEDGLLAKGLLLKWNWWRDMPLGVWCKFFKFAKSWKEACRPLMSQSALKPELIWGCLQICCQFQWWTRIQSNPNVLSMSATTGSKSHTFLPLSRQTSRDMNSPRRFTALFVKAVVTYTVWFRYSCFLFLFFFPASGCKITFSIL